MFIVLVCLGCYDKMPQTKWPTQQKLISSQFRRQRIRDKGVSMVGFWEDSLLQLQRVTFYPCAHVASSLCKPRESKLFTSLLVKSLTPPRGPHSHDLILLTSQRPPLVHKHLGSQSFDVWIWVMGDENIQSLMLTMAPLYFHALPLCVWCFNKVG